MLVTAYGIPIHFQRLGYIFRRKTKSRIKTIVSYGLLIIFILVVTNLEHTTGCNNFLE